MHFSSLIFAAFVIGSGLIHLFLHILSQGLILFSIALYGQAFAHKPQLIHNSLLIVAVKLLVKFIAFLGQASLHLWAIQPLQASVTLYPPNGHSSQAISITFITLSLLFVVAFKTTLILSSTIALSLYIQQKNIFII